MSDKFYVFPRQGEVFIAYRKQFYNRWKNISKSVIDAFILELIHDGILVPIDD